MGTGQPGRQEDDMRERVPASMGWADPRNGGDGGATRGGAGAAAAFGGAFRGGRAGSVEERLRVGSADAVSAAAAVVVVSASTDPTTLEVGLSTDAGGLTGEADRPVEQPAARRASANTAVGPEHRTRLTTLPSSRTWLRAGQRPVAEKCW